MIPIKSKDPNDYGWWLISPEIEQVTYKIVNDDGTVAVIAGLHIPYMAGRAKHAIKNGEEKGIKNNLAAWLNYETSMQIPMDKILKCEYHNNHPHGLTGDVVIVYASIEETIEKLIKKHGHVTFDSKLGALILYIKHQNEQIIDLNPDIKKFYGI